MTSVQTTPPDGQLEELSEEECRQLLGLSSVGRIAFVTEDLPIVLPVNFRMLSDDSGVVLVLRTRPGAVIDRAPEQVALEIDGIDGDRQRGWSVLVRGTLHHLGQEEVASLSSRFDPKPWPQEERTSWLAIRTHTITGRKLLASEREWAFPSEAYL